LINISIIELVPVSQKSFYGKAVVLEDETTISLKSYNTIVMRCDKLSGKIIISGLYSMTTRKHIRAFMKYLSDKGLIDGSMLSLTTTKLFERYKGGL
jgi:hypothetical protein